MRIESDKVIVENSQENIFSYVSDLNNIINLLPQDKVTEWVSTTEDCSFKVQNAATIPLHKVGHEGNAKLFLKSGEKSPFPFDLTIHIEELEDNKCEGYIEFDGKLNAFLKMMVEKPLTQSQQAPTTHTEPKDDENNDESIESSQFGFEKDLQNFLVKNLHLIEPNLKLYESEGITGVEYPVGNRFIDILAIAESNELVVIELKVSKGYDRVIGQLLRYMAWIEKNLADEEQKVRGVIIAKQISEDLKLACSKIGDVKLMEYELSVKLRMINGI